MDYEYAFVVGVCGIIGGLLGTFLVNYRIFTLERRMSSLEARQEKNNARIRLTGIPMIDNFITEALKDPKNVNMIIDGAKQFFGKGQEDKDWPS